MNSKEYTIVVFLRIRKIVSKIGSKNSKFKNVIKSNKIIHKLILTTFINYLKAYKNCILAGCSCIKVFETSPK